MQFSVGNRQPVINDAVSSDDFGGRDKGKCYKCCSSTGPSTAGQTSAKAHLNLEGEVEERWTCQ